MNDNLKPQTKSVLGRLRIGWCSPLDSLNELKCSRLAARIHELKKSGYHIEREIRTTSNGVRWAEYRLLEDAV